MEWRHNDGLNRWELGSMDIDRNEFMISAWISDEIIDESETSSLLTNETISQAEVLTMLATTLKHKLGSVPPPLEKYLTADGWEPGRWWRVLDTNGKLWNETSSEEEARLSMWPGFRLQRQWRLVREEWRDSD